MEYTFTELKKKTVIDVTDGSKLGKVTDITISFPERCFKSLVVKPVFCFSEGDKTIVSPCDIERIGEDAILVRKRGCRPEPRSDEADEE